jgi:hypothetical protein
MVYAIWQIGPTNTNRETLLQREYRLQYRNSTSTTHEIENTSLTLYFEFVVIADVTCLIDRVSEGDWVSSHVRAENQSAERVRLRESAGRPHSGPWTRRGPHRSQSQTL